MQQPVVDYSQSVPVPSYASVAAHTSSNSSTNTGAATGTASHNQNQQASISASTSPHTKKKKQKTSAFASKNSSGGGTDWLPPAPPSLVKGSSYPPATATSTSTKPKTYAHMSVAELQKLAKPYHHHNLHIFGGSKNENWDSPSSAAMHQHPPFASHAHHDLPLITDDFPELMPSSSGPYSSASYQKSSSKAAPHEEKHHSDDRAKDLASFVILMVDEYVFRVL